MRTPTPALCAFLLLAACASASEQNDFGGKRANTQESERYPGEPIEVRIQRMAPGVVVRHTGQGIAFEIRNSSFGDNANTAPLFIVNGLPYEPGPGGVLRGVDPYEIESIKVLKGAETSIYGIDGANGVIIITTKTGPPPQRDRF